MSKPQLHFVGIGGIGMSGIAEVFHNQGYPVSGSDASENDTFKRLASLGIRVSVGHRAENVRDAAVVVVSSAIRSTNPEVIEAKRLRIPVIPRAEMLGELMRGKTGIAIAGTHGKTTTTSMMATVMTRAGFDPTIVIGGKVDALGGNAKLGKGTLVVAEADESDGSFKHLPATYAIVTNIDADHLDHFGSLEKIDSAFCDFVGSLPFYGVAVVCGDDPGIKRCLTRFTKPYLTYGLSKENDYSIENLKEDGKETAYDVFSKEKGRLGTVKITIPGRHNALNSLAVVALSDQIEIPFEKIAEGLASFRGVKRRFETRFHDKNRGIRVIDDYGHHPTEIAATLQAARQFWGSGRIVTIFQPHRYTRTQNSEAEFTRCFTGADLLLMTDIYSAGEDPIEGVDSRILIAKIQAKNTKPRESKYTGNLEDTAKAALLEIRDGDLVLCMGAGSITKLPDLIVAGLEG